jgi:hypothetical protein
LRNNPDTIRRRDQYRLGHIRKSPGKHPAKTADLGQRPFIESAAGVLANFCDSTVRVIY